MPGKKRSEIDRRLTQTEVLEPLEREGAERPPAGVKEYRGAFCPVCGMSHGVKRLQYPERGYYIPPSTMNYWEWLALREEELGFGDEPPFGVIQEVGRGKGHSFKVVGHFSPSEDQDGFYPLVKARLLLALTRWLKMGWLKAEEVESVLAESELP